MVLQNQLQIATIFVKVLKPKEGGLSNWEWQLSHLIKVIFTFVFLRNSELLFWFVLIWFGYHKLINKDLIVFANWMTISFSFSFIYVKLTFIALSDYLFVNSNLVWDSLRIPMNLGHWNLQYILIFSKRSEGLTPSPPFQSGEMWWFLKKWWSLLVGCWSLSDLWVAIYIHQRSWWDEYSISSYT